MLKPLNMHHLGLVAIAAVGCVLLAWPYIKGMTDTAAALALLAGFSSFVILSGLHYRQSIQLKPQIEFAFCWALLWGGVFGLLCGWFLDIAKLFPVSGALLTGFAVSRLLPISIFKLSAFIACLMFAVPVPLGLELSLGFYLAELEARGFVSIAQMFDLPVYQFGAQVVSGDKAATINSDCSGTMLIWPALLGGIVAAETSRQAGLKKLLIIVLSVPLALVLNILRLGVLLALNFQAPDAVVTAFHDMLGWAVMPLVWVLPIMLWGQISKLPVRLPRVSAAEFAVFCLVGLVGILGASQYSVKAVNASPVALPYYVPGWAGQPVEVPAKEARILAADWVERRRYQSLIYDREVLLTFIQHGDRSKAREHSSQHCFEAMGWKVEVLDSVSPQSGVFIRHLLVRSFNHVQAVTELVIEADQATGERVTRLQFVESPNVPLDKRQKSALVFAQAFGVTADDG